MEGGAREERDEPVNEAKLVDGLDGEDALRHVEASDVFAEGVVFDEHRHEVSSGEKLHEEVEVVGVLERVVELHDPWRVGFGEDVALGSDVGELMGEQSATETAREGRGDANLVLLEHLGLLQTLHRVDFVGVDLLHQSDLRRRETSSARACPSFALEPKRTSPKAPFPMTLTVRKSSNPRRVLRKRRNDDSVRPS